MELNKLLTNFLLFCLATINANEKELEKLLETTTLKKLPSIEIKIAHTDFVKKTLWQKYKQEQNSFRLQEFKNKQIHCLSKIMRYDYKTRGKKSKNGYPLYIALHGGGGAPAWLNDRQWHHMKVYYLSGVKNGIYLAPRGISNTWNLHFRAESYVMYDRLIENMILFANVDPNRVYLLGFSAGGDGVYQITTRMPDRFAAANMSAGHHNGVKPKNLYNVPFLMQVGEKDHHYDRNKATVGFYLKLHTLKKQFLDGYIFDLFMHANKPHNFRDNHPQQAPQYIISDPKAWLDKNEYKTTAKNTHAIFWVNKHKRNPYPTKIIWDLTTRAHLRDRNQFGKTTQGIQMYWLEVPKSPKAKEIQVSLDKKDNCIHIHKAGDFLQIYLNKQMLDLSKPIDIHFPNKQKIQIQAKINLKTMVQTMLDRSDPYYIFEAGLTLSKKESEWQVTN